MKQQLDKLIGQTVTVVKAGRKNLTGMLTCPNVTYLVMVEGDYRRFDTHQVKRVVGNVIVLK